MDIVVAKKDFLRLVSRCQGVADRKSAMPILADVLITAKDGAVAVAASDLYQSISGIAHAEVSKPGTICINAVDLRERLANMPDWPVRLRVLADRAELSAVGTKRKFQMSTRSAADFPPAPKMPEAATHVSADSDGILSLIERVHLAISQDATRAHVNSCLFEVYPQGLRLVATDGHRLSMAEGGTCGGAATTALVPRSALLEIRKLMGASSCGVSFSFRHAFITDTEATEYSCKLTDATFPPYQQVIPKDAKHTVTVPRLQLIDALEAVSVASSDRTGGVALDFDADFITVTAQSPEGGDASDVVTCTGGPSETMRIGFNAGYLVDALSVLDDDEVTIGFTGELDPAVVRADGFVGVVMPMRV